MKYLQNVLTESKDPPPPQKPFPRALFCPERAALTVLVIAALRLYPAVPLNSREALQDTVLPKGGGRNGQDPVFIPKGTPVAYSVYAMHRSEDLNGPSANKFLPERWDSDCREDLRSREKEMRMPLNDDSANAKWRYLPFNEGPRICPGSKASESF